MYVSVRVQSISQAKYIVKRNAIYSFAPDSVTELELWKTKKIPFLKVGDSNFVTAIQLWYCANHFEDTKYECLRAKSWYLKNDETVENRISQI